jgi:hypothetical protein
MHVYEPSLFNIILQKVLTFSNTSILLCGDWNVVLDRYMDTYNIMLKAEHIPGKINSIADALSRSDWQRFKTLCPEADPEPTL